MYYMDNRLAAWAIIPGLLIIIYVYGKDKVEKEPLGLIIKLLIFGAISAEVAGIWEGYMYNILPQYPEGTVPYALITAFCMAAFCEEIVKYLAMRLGSRNHKSFNYRFDGIVYGVSAAVGFALLENIMYVSMYGFPTAVTRAFTAVPLHAFCGVFMGVFYSYSKKAAIVGDNGAKSVCTLLALGVPMLIHGTYDFLCFYRTNLTQTVFLAGVVMLYIAAVMTIRKNSREDHLGGFYPRARTIDYDTDKY